MNRTFTLTILLACALTCILVTTLRHASTSLNMVWYGPAPHPYISEVRGGVADYESHVKEQVVAVVGQEWTQDNEDSNVEALATQGHRAFSIYPVDAAGAAGLFRQLKARGHYVVAYGAEPSPPEAASFTVATDVRAAARIACKTLVQRMGGHGNILNVLEAVTDVNTQKRQQGVEQEVATHPGVSILQTIADVPQVSDAANKIQDVLAARGQEIDGIILTGYNTSVAAASVLAEWNRRLGHRPIHAVCIDTDTRVIEAIKAGDIDATIAQNPYGHGYIPCAILNRMINGWTPRKEYQFINSGVVVVDRSNLNSFAAQLQKMTDDILDRLPTDYLAPPDH